MREEKARECQHRKAGVCEVCEFMPVPVVVTHSRRLGNFARLTSNMSKPVRVTESNSKTLALLVGADK